MTGAESKSMWNWAQVLSRSPGWAETFSHVEIIFYRDQLQPEKIELVARHPRSNLLRLRYPARPKHQSAG